MILFETHCQACDTIFSIVMERKEIPQSRLLCCFCGSVVLDENQLFEQVVSAEDGEATSIPDDI